MKTVDATGNAVITGRISKSQSKSKSITPTANRKKAVAEAVDKMVKEEQASDADATLMEKDSNDEAFSLSSFDGTVEDLVNADAMDLI